MGRGRAKAKQVKVARQLKYNSGGTDLDRLRASWASTRTRGMTMTPTTTRRYEDLEDRYADYVEEPGGDDRKNER